MINKNCFTFAENKFLQMIDFLKSNEANSLNLSEAEEYLQEDGRELLRELLVGYLEKRGVGDIGQSVTGSDGIKRTHKRLRTKKNQNFIWRSGNKSHCVFWQGGSKFVSFRWNAEPSRS